MPGLYLQSVEMLPPSLYRTVYRCGDLDGSGYSVETVHLNPYFNVAQIIPYILGQHVGAKATAREYGCYCRDRWSPGTPTQEQT